tara:strand:+ start:2434 stop:2622 length:189 start_codon:yes stop_codon:yes gene_type:complete
MKQNVEIGDKIVILEGDMFKVAKHARVRVTLASQFLAYVPKFGDVFLFYKDKNVTWEVANEH